MSDPVIYTRKVRYSDTDAFGHVFNANYFVYFDDAITDYLDQVWAAPGSEPEYRFVTVRAECDFRSSGELGEILVTAVRVEKVGNTSFTFVLEITEEASGRVIAQGKETLVVVDAKSMRPAPVPEALRAAISQLDRQGVAQATA